MFRTRLLLLVTSSLSIPLLADRLPSPLKIDRTNGTPQVILPQSPIAPISGMDYRLWIESSPDLVNWDSGTEIVPDATGRAALSTDGTGHRFHRLRGEMIDTGENADAADSSGLNRVFAGELANLGPISPATFAENFIPPTAYLESLGFNPTEALYWADFNADPAIANIGKAEGDPGWRAFDFRLNPQELDVFMQNGFVVSERLGSTTFANVFYSIFNDDLPVFVSADSALHAWHFTYQHMLAEMEETMLMANLKTILDGMATTLNTLPENVRNGPLSTHLDDADYFLAVGRALLKMTEIPANEQPVVSDHPRFAPTMQAIANRETYTLPPGFEMFGGYRLIDFSQFQPRSYYTRSLQLQHYFQSMMWLARANLRVFGGNNLNPDQALRELGTAVTLALLLQESEGNLPRRWQDMDAALRLFVGRTDSMNFAHLLPLLNAQGLTSLSSITSPQQILNLQSAIASGTLGLQLIPGDVHLTPLGPSQAQLPRAFAFMGQRFTPDGWAMSQVTYDRILWPEEIWPLTLNQKVLRRFPSSLDIAYSVLANDSVADLIANRMLQPWQAGNFRDGYPYAHNLVATRHVFDQFTANAWSDTLYGRWLHALRTLSAPTTDPQFPQPMRTQAWARRTLNTQLASYTELKHDTLLYGEQPYASIFLCEYPAGFVEPIPAFWSAMASLADAAANGQASLSLTDAIVGRGIYKTPNPDPDQTSWVRPGTGVADRIATCRTFASHMRTLQSLALKELAQEPFTTTDLLFIQGLMNSQDHEYYGPTFDGWYPELFYEDYALLGGSADENGCNKHDPLVADIFTAPADLLDPTGGILHEATGNIDLLMISVDNGPDRMVYAGPVLSHYEFVVPGPNPTRLTDESWYYQLLTEEQPERPQWTQPYLVR